MMNTKKFYPIQVRGLSWIGGLVNEALPWELTGLMFIWAGEGSEAGEDYVEFLRELSISCRANNLEKLSVRS